MAEQSLIYFVFLLSDGSFMGSGVTEYSDDVYGSTLIENPPYDSETQSLFFRSGVWVVE